MPSVAPSPAEPSIQFLGPTAAEFEASADPEQQEIMKRRRLEGLPPVPDPASAAKARAKGKARAKTGQPPASISAAGEIAPSTIYHEDLAKRNAELAAQNKELEEDTRWISPGTGSASSAQKTTR